MDNNLDCKRFDVRMLLLVKGASGSLKMAVDGELTDT